MAQPRDAFEFRGRADEEGQGAVRRRFFDWLDRQAFDAVTREDLLILLSHLVTHAATAGAAELDLHAERRPGKVDISCRAAAAGPGGDLADACAASVLQVARLLSLAVTADVSGDVLRVRAGVPEESPAPAGPLPAASPAGWLVDGVLAVAGELDRRRLAELLLRRARSLTRAASAVVEGIVPGEVLVDAGRPGDPVPIEGSFDAGDRPSAGGPVLRMAGAGREPVLIGMPDGIPPVGAVLGAAIIVDGGLAGRLYVGRRPGDAAFSDDDEAGVRALTGAAAVALAHAGTVDQLRRRQASLAAVRGIAVAALAGVDLTTVLQQIASHARELAHADLATIALPDRSGADLVVRVAEGARRHLVLGQHVPRHGSVSGDVLRSGRAIALDDASLDPRVSQPIVRAGDLGPAVFLPLWTAAGPIGTLNVANRRGGPTFDAATVALLASFAAQTSLIVGHAAARHQAGGAVIDLRPAEAPRSGANESG